MNARRTTAALFASAVVAAGLAASFGGSASAAPAFGGSFVIDGGFENTTYDDGGVGVSSTWESHDSWYDASAICVVGGWCDTTDTRLGNAPHAGNGWVWFGYSPEAHSTAYVKQSVLMPGGTVRLTCTYRNGSVDAPFDATLKVQVNGVTVKEHVEASVAEDGYTQYSVDIRDTELGEAYELAFVYDNGSGAPWDDNAVYNNMTIDNVSITQVD